jgi:hypothetical protein
VSPSYLVGKRGKRGKRVSDNTGTRIIVFVVGR